LYCALGFKQTGFYIDIGANDPEMYSVTKAFYDRGWRGVNIEPLPSRFRALAKARTRDINLNIGCSDREGELVFGCYQMLSTCDPLVMTAMEKEGKTLEKISIAVLTLDMVLDRYYAENEPIDFCKIDVEGYEKNVLQGLNYSRYRPRLFCVESTEPCTLTQSHEAWEEILTRNGYQLGYIYGFNRYYIDAQSPDAARLFASFMAIAHWEQTHKIYSYASYHPRLLFSKLKYKLSRFREEIASKRQAK
jgi:FkbM family methyltransferase